MNNNIPDGWKETTLGEVADVQTGPFGSQLHESDYVETGTPMITVENLVNQTIELTTSTPKVSKEDKDRLSKYTLHYGDTVFSRVGSVDRCAFVSKKENGWLFSGRLLRVRPIHDVSTKYIFYWLSQDRIKEYVRKIAVGATMPSINTALLSIVPVVSPPLPEQKAIAEVLSSFDNKIELLREQNKTLEAIAQTIFNEWFVRFNFPDENGKPYQTSGGKMIDSELGLIPEGWRVGKLGEILELNYGKALKEEDREDGIYPVFGSSGKVGSHDEFLVKGPGIIVGRKGTIGTVIWSDENFFPIDTAFFVADKLGINNLLFHYQILKIIDFNRLGSDSAVPGLNRHSVHAISAIIPEVERILKFCVIVDPFTNKIQNNNSQIQTLSTLRDELLPKLMKGEIRLKGVYL